MKTPFILYICQLAPDDLDTGGGGDTYEQASGVGSVKDTITEAVRRYGIDGRRGRDGWFHSSTPAEDREYFEKGIHTYYSLHFPLLSPRALLRVDQMIAKLRHVRPDTL